MQEGRWKTVTPSEFTHERKGLEAIQRLLPDSEPWRAWSNFTFTAHTGHVREVDLLVVAPSGVYLVELKDWHGKVETRNGTWLQTQPSGRQISHGNPLHLANKKAKELAGLLRQAAGHGDYAPWVAEAVCFTDPGLRVKLAAHDLNGVYSLGGGKGSGSGSGGELDNLIGYISRPPRDDHSRIDATRSRTVARLLERVGIDKSNAQFTVGPYRLDRKPFDSGPTWADYLGHHPELPEVTRVRIYLAERGADQSLRASVERAARREAAVLRGFKHLGVVRLAQYHPSGHVAGPALIFEYDQRTLRLDEYLAQYGDRLDVPARLGLVRQLAETMRSAHSRRLYHRTLAARAIHVIPVRHTRTVGDQDEGWLTPRLELSDWQVALRSGTDRTDPAAAMERIGAPAPSTVTHIGRHLSEAADPYLAPELTVRGADPIALDVYGLGVLTYLLMTGRPPAASQAELLTQLENGEGLRPSAVMDGVSELVDELVQAATAYDPRRRAATVDEFLEMLEVVESELIEPRPQPSLEPQPQPEPVLALGPALSPIVDQKPAEEINPLEAVAGQVLAGRWVVKRRLGTGSTSRAFLVRDLEHDNDARVREYAVLKVALSDGRAAVLRREAETMSRLRPDSRVIRLVVPEPVEIGGKTVLVLEFVGDERSTDDGKGRTRQETVARQLREHGRLTIDELEAYGDYLFGAVDFLEGEGIWHRDLKPDNIAIRVRPNRTRELVLIDFSLAGYPVQETSAGTEGYLDPFIGTLTRSVYDAHAERYALAVTLHEMASRELPSWGEGQVGARQTDPAEEPFPKLAKDAFEPRIRDSLAAFFEHALNRDASKRFSDLKPMRDAWKRIFLALDEVRPSRPSRHSATAQADTQAESADGVEVSGALAEAEPEDIKSQRDEAAREAGRDTLLDLAGLSPSAVAFLHGLDLTTVGDLLALSQRGLINKPGLGSKTRGEIQDRVKQWRLSLAEQAAAPLAPAGREAAEAEIRSALESGVADAAVAAGGDISGAGLGQQALRRVSLDALATIFVPAPTKNGRNRSSIDVIRVLLRLPNDLGELPPVPVWPNQREVADAEGVKLSRGRIPQILREERLRWVKNPVVLALRDEIVELVRDLGRVASAAEVADALAVRRGTELQDPKLRQAMALAAVRAAVEVEQLDQQARSLAHLANRDSGGAVLSAGLLALEVGDDDGPETPSAPGLLDYAVRLGKVADRLAALETLPTSATVLTELAAISRPSGVIEWDERRMVELAAAASQRAAATPRMEIYPRDLPLVRALRITQAGVVGWTANLSEEHQPGLTAAEIHRRVRARFPELGNLPVDAQLTKALAEAGFELRLGVRAGSREERYLPKPVDGSTSDLTSFTMRYSATTRQARPTRYSDNPDVAAVAMAEEKLTAAAAPGRDGFRVLTVRTARAVDAGGALARRYRAERVSVARLFVAALHELVDPRPRPTWKTILRADVAAAGSPSRMKFGEYAKTAWGGVEPKLTELVKRGGEAGPLLLTDSSVLARYDAMDVLERLAALSRQGGRPLWLLCPQADPGRPPQFGVTVVPYQAGLGEWIALADAWTKMKLNEPTNAGDLK